MVAPAVAAISARSTARPTLAAAVRWVHTQGGQSTWRRRSETNRHDAREREGERQEGSLYEPSLVIDFSWCGVASWVVLCLFQLSGIAEESAWFRRQSMEVRTCLTTTIRDMIENQIEGMGETEFFKELDQRIQEVRQTINVETTANEQQQTDDTDNNNAAATDIVIYGIGRYAEWTLISKEISVDTIHSGYVRTGIRNSSRPPQLQLACIIAVARTMTTQNTPSAPHAAASIDESTVTRMPRIYMYDPMLSELEHSIARGLGIEIIDQNEEGKRNVTRPTLFYMPHCPQVPTSHLSSSSSGSHFAR